MNIIIFTFIFLIVLFLYLHVVFHLKKGTDLEIYEIDIPSKNKLEEICDLRQPVTFKFNNEKLLENCSLLKIIDNYSAFDINIRNVNTKLDDKQDLYIPLALNETIELFRNDKEKNYISMNNRDFLEETALIKNYIYNDEFLRPSMVSKCIYDLLTGTIESTTPLMYNLNYRNYFLVTQGNITIKLIPPNYSKYLYSINDYLNFEFSSPVNPWDTQEMYKNDFDKIKTLEVNLEKGDIIHIPSYWWYSIKYNKLSSICVFNYRTYMNTIAILPYLSLHLLQKTNVKREIVKKNEKVLINE
jgi:hypothetical protein